MNQKELIESFMMISKNEKYHLVFMAYTKIFHRCKGWYRSQQFYAPFPRNVVGDKKTYTKHKVKLP